MRYDTHIHVDHEIWIYVYYIMYLQWKDKSEYDGDEISVWANYVNGDPSFMPYHSTLFLKSQEQEDPGLEENITNKLEEKMNQALADLNQRLQEKQKELQDKTESELKS